MHTPPHHPFLPRYRRVRPSGRGAPAEAGATVNRCGGERASVDEVADFWAAYIRINMTTDEHPPVYRLDIQLSRMRRAG